VSLISILLVGCAAPPSPAVLYRRDPARDIAHRRTPNLLLGPSAEHFYIAQTFDYRSDWPSVSNGYHFDEYSTYDEVIYDDQFFYDSLGGFYFRAGEERRSGSHVR
jgi:hypothetical protein